MCAGPDLKVCLMKSIHKKLTNLFLSFTKVTYRFHFNLSFQFLTYLSNSRTPQP
jgi:hypothetical protein